MKRSRSKTLMVALVAVFALAAVASASASAALPEFTGGGATKFTGSSGVLQMTIEEPGGGSYVCKSVSITGTIVPPKSLTGVVVTFHGFNGCAFCEQTSHKEELVTKEMTGTIGYLSKSSKTVGLLLTPVAEPIAECFHFASSSKMQGSVIAKLTPLGASKEFTLTYEESHGTQSWRKFEGEEVLHSLSLLTVGFPKATEFALGGSVGMKLEHELKLNA